MAHAITINNAGLAAQFRKLFTTRDFIFHDGRDLRRFSLPGKTQALMAGVAAVTVVFSGYGVAQALVDAIVVSGVAGDVTPEAKMARMQAEVAKMQADIEATKQAAKVHAARLEQRQAVISATLSGNVDRAKLDQALPGAGGKTSAMTDEVLEPLRRLEARQLALVAKAQAAGEQRFARTAAELRRLGLRPERYVPVVAGGMGGPFEAADSNEEASAAAADADAQFRSLFQTWKKLDTLEQTVISIPSMQPVDNVQYTSTFGVRSDPFRGTAAMHAGVDIPGAIGTPIYATADGVVSRSGRFGGYGNLVEINHGKGIETRYGHLSKIMVVDNSRVKRGQVIGLMGSTGRSTGSHLHYEVRVDGRAVNPVPFLQNGEYLTAIQNRQAAVGGPASAK